MNGAEKQGGRWMDRMRELLLRDVRQHKPHFCIPQAREGRTARGGSVRKLGTGLGSIQGQGKGFKISEEQAV